MDKGVIPVEQGTKSQMEWITMDLCQPMSSLSNRTTLRIRQKGVNWLRSHFRSPNLHVFDPLPSLPDTLFPSNFEKSVAMEAIVDYIKWTTGRKDEVTYQNAHWQLKDVPNELKKINVSSLFSLQLQAKSILQELTMPCIPALHEKCQVTVTACCQGKCCPIANRGPDEGECKYEC